MTSLASVLICWRTQPYLCNVRIVLNKSKNNKS